MFATHKCLLDMGGAELATFIATVITVPSAGGLKGLAIAPQQGPAATVARCELALGKIGARFGWCGVCRGCRSSSALASEGGAEGVPISFRRESIVLWSPAESSSAVRTLFWQAVISDVRSWHFLISLLSLICGRGRGEGCGIA